MTVMALAFTKTGPGVLHVHPDPVTGAMPNTHEMPVPRARSSDWALAPSDVIVPIQTRTFWRHRLYAFWMDTYEWAGWALPYRYDFEKDGFSMGRALGFDIYCEWPPGPLKVVR